MIRVLAGCLLTFLAFSCQLNQEEKIGTNEFILQDGFQIDLVAAEPLLDTPVAMTFDEKGRIWVVELPGYMRDIDGTDENRRDGRIVVLEDMDQDGQMDIRRVFLDNLMAPRTLALVYNGLLYTDSTQLWWTPLEGDQPGEKVLVDSLYVVGGNIEHQSNGLLYHLDNWIYSAKSNARYRQVDGQWEREVTKSRGQWGLTNDDAGRLFYNDNSNPLMGDYLPPNQLVSNPYFKPKYSLNQPITRDRRVFPVRATAVNRGYMEGVLDDNQKLRHFTSACGPVIYRGDQFGLSYYGNAFVCGPEANLVKRYAIQEDSGRVVAQPVYENTEFLLSTDETFRPVNLYNGPDGALYVLDMRKGVIQHRAYMTSYLREQILDKGLDSISGIGRIYRVYNAQHEIPTAPDLSKLGVNEWPGLLQHANAYIREKAQQFLVFNNQSALTPEIEQIALDAANPLGQIHALWTLEGLNDLSSNLLLEVANNTDIPEVVNQVLQLSAKFPDQEEMLIPIFEMAITLKQPEVDLQLCHLIGQLKHPNAKKWWLQLAQTYQNDPVFCEALLSGIGGKELKYLPDLPRSNAPDTLTSFLNRAVENKKNNRYQGPRFPTQNVQDTRTRGASLYNQFCASCHAVDGTGHESLAPPLVDSEYLTGTSKRLVLLMLHGLQGPVTVNGKRYEMNLVMPGIKNNPALGDAEIKDLLIFIQNSFASTPADVSVEDIRRLREETESREEMYTEEELLRLE